MEERDFKMVVKLWFGVNATLRVFLHGRRCKQTKFSDGHCERSEAIFPDYRINFFYAE